MNPRPLAGRRVVVTRAGAQADDLAQLLEAVGAVPVIVSLTEVVIRPEEVERLAALPVERFRWLVVTSPNGAHHGAAAWAAARAAAGAAPRAAVPPGVAAVGASTAAALAEHGIAATLVPRRQSAEGLLDEFPAAPEAGGEVLLVQGTEAAPTMATGLAALGWRVTAVAPYATHPVRPSAAIQLAALAADAVLFASGSAARAWVEVFGTSTPPVAVAIGPQTAAAAQAAGLKISAVAADHSLEGLVHEVVAELTGHD